MRDLGNCDHCGAPIGFYGCPKHGTDCYIIEEDEDGVPTRCAECGGDHRPIMRAEI
jgi:hypothetical protein